MGLELTHGGHISHGYQTAKRRVSETAHRFKSVPYFVDETTGIIDYDDLEQAAITTKPKVIVAGTSAYSRLVDYPRMRQVADRVGAFLHCDMAHTCGLVAAKVIPSPFESCHVVTTTVTKTFQGAGGAMIFYRKELGERINRTVFPRFQCGTNNKQIISLAVALLLASTPTSKAIQANILESARTLARSLSNRGYTILSGGTENHMVIVDLRNRTLDGSYAERVLELASVSCNRNVIPGDTRGSRSGIRFGTAGMVSRGLQPSDFERVADIVHRGITIASRLSAEMELAKTTKSLSFEKKLEEFTDFVTYEGSNVEILRLKEDVENWMKEYPPTWGSAYQIE